MDGGKGELLSIISCIELGPNCTETLALSAGPTWRGNGSALDAYRLVEHQLPASAAPTVSNRTPSEKIAI
ncbi:hypothetical protein CgunFtcFv8_016853 [Champsocephalus gunnari]|uniref:Uncharacterized protein n=1 Tax=Champsocephalus gunnari TaxID=52237 RepID=A0AAN8HDS7_CHAGU|nr:hypothetical protein CgunFtcFv8_016853 [Champsocephalus gunnari]